MSQSIEGESKTPILIIEDDRAIAIMYKTIFTLDGIFNPIIFPTGGEGIAYFEANRGKVHLVITDRDLPDLKGEVVAERIRQINGNTDDPYIFMVSGGNPDSRQMLAAGINELIPKPVSVSSLLRVVTQANQRFQSPKP